MRDRKRFYRLRVSIGFATLALVAICFLCAAAQLRGDEVVVYVSAQHWTQNDLLVTAEADQTHVVAGCFGTPATDFTLPYGGSAIVRNLPGQCSSPAIAGLRTIFVKSGAAVFVSEAQFEDGVNVSTVAIPPLTHAFLPANLSTYQRADLVVSRVENASFGRSTFIAFFSSAPAIVRITLLDGSNTFVASELVNVGEFTWYQLQTPLAIGRAVITREPLPLVGCPGCNAQSNIYAVAFVGLSSGGSPRVEVPKQTFSIAGP